MKQSRQENLIYLVLWGLLFASPLLSLYVRTMNDTNLTFDWSPSTWCCFSCIISYWHRSYCTSISVYCITPLWW